MKQMAVSSDVQPLSGNGDFLVLCVVIPRMCLAADILQDVVLDPICLVMLLLASRMVGSSSTFRFSRRRLVRRFRAHPYEGAAQRH